MHFKWNIEDNDLGLFKATLRNFDQDPLLRKTKLNNACSYNAQNSNFSQIWSYFTEKMSTGFPHGVQRLLCLPAAFYFSELSPATTWCCSCSFSLQEAYTLLSGTSVNHRIEAEQSYNIISIKYNSVLLKSLFYVMYEHASLNFVFWSSGSQSKLFLCRL